LRPLPRKAVLACALAAALAPPPAASANDFQTVYREYKRSGTIKRCHFSDKQLSNAQRQTPPDVEQYAPSFLDALASAREAGCAKKPAAAAPTQSSTPTPSSPTPVPAKTPPAPAQPAQAVPTPAPPDVPAQLTVAGVPSPPVDHPKRDDSAPVAVWLLAILGGLALLAASLAALAWWFGWSAERFTRPFRASSGEFGERLLDFRAEFGEWVRDGR